MRREAGRSSGMVSAGGVMLGPESSPLDFHQHHQLLWVILISSALGTAGNRSRIPWNCWKSHINIKAMILKSKTKWTKSRELLNQAWTMLLNVEQNKNVRSYAAKKTPKYSSLFQDPCASLVLLRVSSCIYWHYCLKLPDLLYTGWAINTSLCLVSLY